MVRDKFLFSIRDLQVKERLLREEKLTLEKAISMARASEASKERIKVLGTKEQNVNIENPTVNEIRAGGGRQEKNPPRRPGDQVRAHKKESARFVVLLTRGDLALLWAKRLTTAKSEIILRRFAGKDCGILAGKRYTQSLNWRAVSEVESSESLLKTIGTSRSRLLMQM